MEKKKKKIVLKIHENELNNDPVIGEDNFIRNSDFLYFEEE